MSKVTNVLVMKGRVKRVEEEVRTVGISNNTPAEMKAAYVADAMRDFFKRQSVRGQVYSMGRN